MDNQTQTSKALLALGEKAIAKKGTFATEEAVKNGLIMPFIQILGYNVFEPDEVVPEYTADVGTKKGEKVDYAILQNGQPVIFIECKASNEDLTKHSGQLFRYFATQAKTRFGILTNGYKYQFFTDLEEKNLMDNKAFLEIDITNLNEDHIAQIELFHKSKFDAEGLSSTAGQLKYLNSLKVELAKELKNPSEELVKLLIPRVSERRATTSFIAEITPLVKRAVTQTINEIIKNTFTNAMKDEEEKKEIEEDNNNEVEDDGIVTSQEEINGFMLVRVAIKNDVDLKRVIGRDTKSYFGVILDDNNRKPICKLWFNNSKKYLETFDTKIGTKHLINTIEDIIDHKEDLIKAIKQYDEPN
jgi:hypothetical protein